MTDTDKFHPEHGDRFFCEVPATVADCFNRWNVVDADITALGGTIIRAIGFRYPHPQFNTLADALAYVLRPVDAAKAVTPNAVSACATCMRDAATTARDLAATLDDMAFHIDKLQGKATPERTR